MMSLKELRAIKRRKDFCWLFISDQGWHCVLSILGEFIGTARQSEVLEVFGEHRMIYLSGYSK